MTLYQYLLEQFGTNEPIMTNEIFYKGYSKPWIYKELKKLCEQGKMIRYEKGVYYIPTETILGPSVLNPRSVIEKKYIRNGLDDIIGYYSGYMFMNQLKLTAQMPNVIVIFTNNETSNIRNVQIGSQKVQLRKARTKITRSNAAILCFLELMNSMSASFLDNEKKKIIDKYILENGITRKDITEYAPVFPDKAMRTLVESEVIYSVAH